MSLLVGACTMYGMIYSVVGANRNISIFPVPTGTAPPLVWAVIGDRRVRLELPRSQIVDSSYDY